MCLVEVEKSPKPIASCAMPVMAEMRVNTKSDKTRIARGGVMEFLLANHPLDCPICDQGGECDLQDISMAYGYGESRMHEYKRGVEDKQIGPLIKTTMTRCIHCTRCIRFTEEVAGDFSLGTTGRGRATEVGTYVENLAASELSSNIVDLCPVGALTNKPYAFQARPWELKSVPSVDIIDTILPNISIDSRGVEVLRILPRINEEVNEEWLGDKSRHALDGNRRQRLTMPLLKKDKHVDITWNTALEEIERVFSNVKSEDIQAIIGEHVDLESMVALKDLMNRLDVDDVSLGRNSLNVDNSFKSGYLMNSRIRGIEDSDLLLLVGTNPRYESPVLNARIRKAVNKQGLKVGLIGSPYDMTYEYSHLGNTTKIIAEIIEGTHSFCSKIARAKLPMLIVGSNAFKSEEGKELYKALLKLSKLGNFVNEKQKWNGFNILHNDISSIGALELGIKPFNYNNSKKPKVVVLMNYDSFEKEDIPEDAYVIYIGSHGSKGSERANLILPGATYLEKSGTYVSTEGRVETTRPSVQPPYLAREDWEIIRAMSEALDMTLPYDDLYDVRNRLTELSPSLVKYGIVDKNSFGKLLFEKYENENINLQNYMFEDAIDNYYMTDTFTRASPTMAKCSHQLNPKRFKNFKNLFSN